MSRKNRVVPMLEDDREIAALDYEEGPGPVVGQCGVTAIIAYGEPGDCAYVPWFAVYRGEHITERWSTAPGIIVAYKEDA